MASWKKVITIFTLASILLIHFTGCGTPVTIKIGNVFEKVAQSEVNIATLMETLTQLEVKDNQQYKRILNQGKQDNRNVQTLIDRSSQGLDERKQIIAQLKNIFDDAYGQIEKIDAMIEQLPDENMKQQAMGAYTAYKTRYHAFLTLYEKYNQLLQSEQCLYDELKQTATTKLKMIVQAVSARNDVYNQVKQFTKQFNESTIKFNALKVEFYKQAGIKVTKKE